jgi:hypothetical protein
LWLDRTRFGVRVDLRGVEVHGRTWLRGSALSERRSAGPQLSGDILSFGYRWV